jgi:hypothetical protein
MIDGADAALYPRERAAAKRERLDDPTSLDERRQVTLPTVTATSSTVASLCRKQRT